jgi:hypothetical protein
VMSMLFLVFDRPTEVAIDQGAIAEEEGQLDVGRYAGNVSDSRRLVEYVTGCNGGYDVKWYVPEFALEEALECQGVIHDSGAGRTRWLWERVHG